MHAQKPPIATNFLSEMLSLILKENSFQFNGKDYLQTHGTAMGTKMAVAFANIFMASIEKEILRQSVNKPLTWKRFTYDSRVLKQATVDNFPVGVRWISGLI